MKQQQNRTVQVNKRYQNKTKSLYMEIDHALYCSI